MQKWGRTDSQPIFYYGRDPRLGKTISFCSFVLTERPEKTLHPCAKPLAAWKKLLGKVSVEGETVLDPFAGSGTTGLAAKETNRKCVMIEINERFCEIIARRMSQEMLAL